MNDWRKQILRSAAIHAAVIALLSITHLHASADVVGKLKFTVKDGADKAEKPIPAARITLHDSAGQRPDITLTTDEKGVATSPLLENRAWKYTAEADTYKRSDEASFTVVADTTTDVEVSVSGSSEREDHNRQGLARCSPEEQHIFFDDSRSSVYRGYSK